MDRILKNGGAERVGGDAAETLGDIVERYGKVVTERAVQYAEHAGRKTVSAEDIELAVDSLK